MWLLLEIQRRWDDKIVMEFRKTSCEDEGRMGMIRNISNSRL
jgi:hypothetical protein